MEQTNNETDAVVIETAPAAFAESTDEPSHTPPQTPPHQYTPNHPEKNLLRTNSEKSIPLQEESIVFAQPQVLTPPRVNGNRKPRSDTITSASAASSSFSTTDDDASGSSSDSSDSEDDVLNTSAATVESDEDLPKYDSSSAIPQEERPVSAVSDVFDEPDEYPDDDGEPSEVITQEDNLIEKCIDVDEELDLPCANKDDLVITKPTDENAAVIRTLSIDEPEQTHFYSNSDCVEVEDEPIETSKETKTLSVPDCENYCVLENEPIEVQNKDITTECEEEKEEETIHCEELQKNRDCENIVEPIIESNLDHQITIDIHAANNEPVLNSVCTHNNQPIEVESTKGWSGRNGESSRSELINGIDSEANNEDNTGLPVNEVDLKNDSDQSTQHSDNNESDESSDADQSDDTQSDEDQSSQNQSEMNQAASNEAHNVEDMDLEDDIPHQSVDITDEQTLSAPPSPNHRIHPSDIPSVESPSESLQINEDLETESMPMDLEADTVKPAIPQTEPVTNNVSPQRGQSITSEIQDKPEELGSMIMSPPTFKSTDEMKYFLKHQLQFSDLGKLFGNVDVSSVMGSGKASDYAQYLGLQPSVKFKCFKCADSTFASLSELKQHQTKCLKQKLDEHHRQAASPRGSSAAGLRSSLNSDNAMDVDLSANTTSNIVNHQNSISESPPENQQIDAKIRITRKVYLCSSCGTYYENWNLFFHMREVHQKFICLLCLGIFPSAERLVHHLEGKHNSRPDVFEHKEQLLTTLKDQCYMMCTVCEHIFSEHDDFTSHSCENYIKACALCGLKFIHKPQCKAGASGKALARQRKDKLKGKSRHKKLLAAATKPTTDDAALDAGESSGLNFSNTLFGTSTSSINGIGGYNFELPQSILSNQTPDAPGTSYSVPPLAPEVPMSYLPQKLLQDDKPPEYPTNSSSSSVSSSSFAPVAAPSNQSHLPRSSANLWPTTIDNGYTEPTKPNSFNSSHCNNGDPSQANPPSMIVPPIGGKSMSLFQQQPQQHRDSLSISEDYLDNRDMEIIYSYINEFDSFGGQDNAKNVSLTEIEPMQVKSPTPSPVPTVEPPRLVPKLKLNLSKAFQTPIESEESSTESDDEDEEEEDEEAAEEEGDEEDDAEEALKYKTPSNASRTPHPLTPHSFAPSSIPPTTPPHINRSIADSDMQIDVELTPDFTDNQSTNQLQSAITHNNTFNEEATNDEDEDVNIEDEDKDSTQDERPAPALPTEPPVPFDGIYLANDDTPITELVLGQPIERMPILDFLRICVKATYPVCLYCNHARKIAVSGRSLALHILAQHRFNATVDSITAEEFYPSTIVQHIKTQMDELADVFFNLETFNTADPDHNIISPKSFECFQCRFPARHHKDLYLHNRKMHLKTIVVCLMCKANFYSYSELSGHMCPGQVNPASNLEVQFRCVLCNLDRIPSAFRLMVHLRKKHGACDICLEYCDDQSRLSSHVCKHKLHHLCYRCGISYRNKADITKHLFWKHGTESQLCKKCLQKKWPHVYHFCVPPASFVCEVCSTTFKRAVALKVHKRLHTEDHPYPCTEDGCDKKFISRKLLLKHVARHSAIEEPEPIPPVEPTPAEIKKTSEDVSTESAIVAVPPPVEEEEKLAAPKPLIDIIKDLPAPNLSESDSSDDSDQEPQSRPASRSLLLNPAAATEVPDEEENQAPVAGIWDNFKSYQAKQTNALDDRDPEPLPPSMLHVSQSDHDYCAMYQRIIPESKKPMRMIPFIEIKQEPIDEDEVASVVPASTVVGKVAQSKLNKSPKKGRSPKKALDKSGSDSSSSDSDSSCSCGSNCSCSSSSDGSSSSSSSSSDVDSSSSEGRRKKAEKLAKRRKSLASPTVQKRDESTENVDVVAAEQIAKPNRDPDLIILESDLDTDESETDEEFYDEHPQRMANQLLADKRKQLMLQTSMNPLNSFDIVENSRPSTPSLPPAEEESKSRKQKGKKRKKDRKNSKCVPSLKLNLASGNVSVVDESVLPEIPSVVQFNNVVQPMHVPPAHTVSSLAHNTDTNLHRFTTNFPPQKVPANINNLKPRLSTGSSCSDADPSLKRSKRRRIPNKFYGYTSDEESTPTTGSSFTNPMDAFKPQPPPILTWCKEDLPQTPTIIRTPPIKTIIKLPSGLNNYGHSAALDYPSIETNSRFKSASPHLEPPPALPARYSQPPIPPIIIRPNRNSLQPPLIEPLRVPAVPVHHIVPPNPTTDVDSDSSDSDSSNDGHLEIQHTPTPTTLHHTPQPFQRTPLPPPPRSTLTAKTPKPRASASRKRVANRSSILTSTPKAKRMAKSANTPKTPAIPAHYLPFMMDPQPAVPPPRPAIAHIPLAAMANQIRYPIMPPAGCRPARAGESVYCYCRCPYDEVSEMIACDGDNCPIEWFHFECVNIMVPPKGTWYCPQCRPKYPAMDDDDDDLPDGI